MLPLEIIALDSENAARTKLVRWWWRQHAYILPSFLVAIMVCGWFATWGEGKFFGRDAFGGYYDAEARSILAGHLDVPPAAIGTEAFIFRGKTYGYFGFGPALLRLPLLAAGNEMDGRWSRLLIFIASVINLICIYQILRQVVGEHAVISSVQRVLHSLFILCAGIGSTNVFLVARSFTYHEAIMWGATFALLFAVSILKYLARPSFKRLLLSAAFAFMAVHSRATVGAGTLLVLAALSAILFCRCRHRSAATAVSIAPAITKPSSHAILAGLAVIVILCSYAGLNYAKFRTFDGVPLKYYDFYVRHPQYLVQTRGQQIHWENIPTTVATYFGTRGIWLDAKFPWIFPSRDAVFIGSPTIMVVEGFSTVPISMPALSLLAIAGILPLFRGTNDTVRRLRLPFIGLALGGGIMLATVAITERYLHDLYPALLIGAAAGVGRIGREKHARSLTAILVVLTLVSISVNCAFALENQRLDAWAMGGVPAQKRTEFKRLQKSIYRFLHHLPPAATTR
ncbi:MAG: hypothetical protein M3R59_01875 [Verrucomicrobiota bacterium]|nr:hypothetical protein [Verrucomicrobiota bacterium]